jgi:hypothetical protein
MSEDDNTPVTKKDLQELKQALASDVEALKNELIEFVRGMETRLLSAFHGYTKGQQARLHDVETSEATIKVRLAALEERMLEVERRLPHSR